LRQTDPESLPDFFIRLINGLIVKKAVQLRVGKAAIAGYMDGAKMKHPPIVCGQRTWQVRHSTLRHAQSCAIFSAATILVKDILRLTILLAVEGLTWEGQSRRQHLPPLYKLFLYASVQ
jgi:hypothetical protein